MAISGHAVVAILAILLQMAIMAWLNMAIHMVNMGVYAKNRKNVDCLWKRNSKKCIGLKVMAKTKYFRKIEPKMADFLCIFVWNLEWLALNQFYSDLPQIFCGSLLCISTCNPSLGKKSSNFFEFWHTLIYGLKPLKWHSFLNIWLQTRLQTCLQTHWLWLI